MGGAMSCAEYHLAVCIGDFVILGVQFERFDNPMPLLTIALIFAMSTALTVVLGIIAWRITR